MVDASIRAGPKAAGAARRLLEPVRDRVSPDRFDELLLLTTELVTNATRHAGLMPQDEIALLVSVSSDRIRVDVTDAGPGFDPAAPPLRGDGTSGWGLVLVERIADRWGVASRDPTAVWFEMDGRVR